MAGGGYARRRKDRLKKYLGSFSNGLASIDVLENEKIRGLDVQADDGLALPVVPDSVIPNANMKDFAFALLVDALGDDARAAHLSTAFSGVISAMSAQNRQWVISEGTVQQMAAFLENSRRSATHVSAV